MQKCTKLWEGRRKKSKESLRQNKITFLNGLNGREKKL